MNKKILLLMLFLSSCTSKNKNIQSTNNPGHSIRDLKNQAYNGDIEAYKKLRASLLDFPREEMFVWGYIMANKNGFKEANIDAFYSLFQFYVGGDIGRLNEIDNKTKTMLLSLLINSESKDSTILNYIKVFKKK